MFNGLLTFPLGTPRSEQRQIEMAIPRNLSYVSGLYRSARLADGFGGVPKGGAVAEAGGDPIRAQPLKSCPSCDPELRPIIRRRARSLPSSPERRRMILTKRRPLCHRVKFADSLGLELAEVKVFDQTEEPSIPLHVLSRLAINSSLCCSGHELEVSVQYLEPEFKQPVDCNDFGERLQQQAVSLEQVTSSDLGITGAIRVLNLGYEKKVSVRYSFTEWRNHYEVQATWQTSAGGANPEFDLFVFRISVPPFLLQLCSTLQFAVRYQVRGTEYWDSNKGSNYSLVCKSHRLQMPRECQESWIHFV